MKLIRKGIIGIIKTTANRFFFKNVDSSIKLLIISVGGTATTTLMNHLSKYIKTNDPFDRDGLKHKRLINLSDYQKVIYLIADPELAYFSLKRRNYLRGNCKKLGFLSYVFLYKKLFIYEVNKVQSEWIKKSKKYPKKYLALNISEIFESDFIIKEFTGINNDEFTTEFPKRKERISKKSF